MHGHDHGAFHIEEICQHAVVQLRRENLQERCAAVFLSNGKAAAGSELEGTGCNEVLNGEAGGSKPVPREPERFLLVHVKNVMHQLEPVVPIQRFRLYAQALEVVENVDLNALQPWFCGFQIVCLNAEGNKFCLDQTVIAACKLHLQHFCVFCSKLVERILSRRDSYGLRVAVLVGGEVYERELKMDGAVKIIEEVAPRIEDRGLVLVLVELIIDVLKLHRFAVIVVCDPANTVREHPLKGNGILRRLMLSVSIFRLGDSRFNLLSVGAA